MPNQHKNSLIQRNIKWHWRFNRQLLKACPYCIGGDVPTCDHNRQAAEPANHPNCRNHRECDVMFALFLPAGRHENGSATSVLAGAMRRCKESSDSVKCGIEKDQDRLETRLTSQTGSQELRAIRQNNRQTTAPTLNQQRSSPEGAPHDISKSA